MFGCSVRLYFFFSSRRRHTRSKRDWSSDVCSSDLSRSESNERACMQALEEGINVAVVFSTKKGEPLPESYKWRNGQRYPVLDGDVNDRSEERRVGRECRCRGWWGEWREEGARKQRE